MNNLPVIIILLAAVCVVHLVTVKPPPEEEEEKVVLARRGGDYSGVVGVDIIETRPVTNILKTDFDAVNELIKSEYAPLADLIQSLLNLISQFRSGKIDFNRFAQSIRAILYARVANRQIVERFLYHVLNKCSVPHEGLIPITGLVTSYDTLGGITTSRVKGDSLLNLGTLGGDGGDIVNSAQAGIAHTGGGENEILSSVDGFNNVGVSDGFIRVQPLPAIKVFDSPTGYGQGPIYNNYANRFSYDSIPAILPRAYNNGWGLSGGFSSSRTRGNTQLGSGVLGGDGGDTHNSIQNGILHSGGGRNGVISSVQGSNNQGVIRNGGTQRVYRPVITKEVVVDYDASLVPTIPIDTTIPAAGGAYAI